MVEVAVGVVVVDGAADQAPRLLGHLRVEGDALHDYTRDILRKLDRDGAMPEMVQVGNETNPELLGGKIPGQPISWARNAKLLNAGMSLGEFQFIYWWEWTHRLLGRLLGYGTIELAGTLLVRKTLPPIVAPNSANWVSPRMAGRRACR